MARRAAIVLKETHQYGMDSPNQVLDAHYDSSATDQPWVIVVHGGSWEWGGREGMMLAVNNFLIAGFAVFNLDYRLSSEAKWPAQSYDVAGALQWIKEGATHFGIDPARGGVYAFSAGAHIASFMAVSGAGANRTNGFIGVSGPYDPYLAWQRGQDDPTYTPIAGAAERLVGCRPNENWAKWQAARAQLRTTPDDAELLLFHALDDKSVPPDCSVRLDYYSKAPSTLVTVPTGGHGNGIVWYDPELRAQAIAFMRRVTA